MSALQFPVPWTFQPQDAVEVSPEFPRVAYCWIGSAPTARGASPEAGTYADASSVGRVQRFDPGASPRILLASDGTDFFDYSENTISVLRRCHDTTNREQALFGADNGPFARFTVHAPWSDGNLYLDAFNATNNDGRLATPFSKTTEWEVLTFVTSLTRGREVWRNGKLIASNPAATGVRTAALPAVSLGNAGGLGSDFQSIALFVVAHTAWHPALIQRFGESPQTSPWQLFRPRTLYIPTAAAGGGTHDTTGALAGAGATTTGAAARTRAHPSSGVLAGGGAVIAGASDHAVPGGAHDTTGALSGGGATVAGTAARVAVHGTTGALSGGGAAIAGAAAHQVTHATSGALAGGGAQVSGSAVGAGGSVSAGGDDDTKPRKRRYIVQDGKRLLVFDNRGEAIEAERAIEQAREAARKAIANAQTKTQAKKTAKRAAQAVSKALDAALLAPPAEVVSLDAIQASVAPYPQAMAALQSALRLRDAEAMYRAWQDMRDDEEDIAAILELM